MEVEVDFFLESGMKGVNFILKQKLVFNKSEMKVGFFASRRSICEMKLFPKGETKADAVFFLSTE